MHFFVLSAPRGGLGEAFWPLPCPTPTPGDDADGSQEMTLMERRRLCRWNAGDEAVGSQEMRPLARRWLVDGS